MSGYAARLVVEHVLGRKLDPRNEVHHVDEDRSNNANTNLVVCPDRTYHQLLHIRMRAREACGDPNKRKCGECKEYDLPSNMVETRINSWNGKNSVRYFHRKCRYARRLRSVEASKLRKMV